MIFMNWRLVQEEWHLQSGIQGKTIKTAGPGEVPGVLDHNKAAGLQRNSGLNTWRLQVAMPQIADTHDKHVETLRVIEEKKQASRGRTCSD